MEEEEAAAAKHTSLELTTRPDSEPVFVKGTWFPTRFRLSISDGRNAWSCNPSQEEVRERASQWDQPVSEYIDLAEQYLGFQQPGSLYAFSDAAGGEKREEVVQKPQLTQSLKLEAEKCLAQSEKFSILRKQNSSPQSTKRCTLYSQINCLIL